MLHYNIVDQIIIFFLSYLPIQAWKFTLKFKFGMFCVINIKFLEYIPSSNSICLILSSWSLQNSPPWLHISVELEVPWTTGAYMKWHQQVFIGCWLAIYSSVVVNGLKDLHSHICIHIYDQAWSLKPCQLRAYNVCFRFHPKLWLGSHI